MGDLTIGRGVIRTEFDHLWHDPDGPRFFVVWGEPGIGKSHLLERFIEHVGRNRSALVDLDVLRVTGRYGDPVRILLEAIADACTPWSPDGAAEFRRLADEAAQAEVHLLTRQTEIRVTQKAGMGAAITNSPVTIAPPSQQDELAALRQSYHPRLLRALVALVEQSTPGEKLLLLDSFERARQFSDDGGGATADVRRPRPIEPAWAEQSLLPALIKAGLRLVVAGWNDIASPMSAHRWRLTEWVPSETGTYLSARGAADPTFQTAVHAACGGHPAWTALVADAWVASVANDQPLTPAEIEFAARREPVDRWLIPMFLERLAIKLQPIVMAAAVPRQFTVDTLQLLFEIQERDTILYDGWTRDLFALSFVRRAAVRGAPDGVRQLHPLIRTAIMQFGCETSPERFRALHARAAEQCAKDGQVHDEHYHRFASKDMSSAGRWIEELRSGERLGLVANTRLLIEVATAPECVGPLEAGAPDVLFEAYFAIDRVYIADLDLRRKTAQSGFELAQRLHSPLEAANFSTNRATERIQSADLDTAERLLRVALNVYQELGNKVGICNTLSNLGWVFELRGQLDLARGLYAETVRLALERGYNEKAVTSILNLAEIAEDDDTRNGKRNLILHAAELAEQGASLAAKLHVRLHLASMATEDGNHEIAREHLQNAFDEATALGDVRMQIDISYTLASSYALSEQWVAVREHAESAAAIAVQENDLATMLAARRLEAQATMRIDLTAAEPMVDRLLDASLSHGSLVVVGAALVLYELAMRQEAAGDMERSWANLMVAGNQVAALPPDQRNNDQTADEIARLCKAVERLGHRLAQEGRVGPLADIGRILLTLHHDSSDTLALAHGWYFAGLGATLDPTNCPEAENALKRSLQLFGPDGDIGCQANAQYALAQMRLRTNRVPEAMHALTAARDLWIQQQWEPGVQASTEQLMKLSSPTEPG